MRVKIEQTTEEIPNKHAETIRELRQTAPDLDRVQAFTKRNKNWRLNSSKKGEKPHAAKSLKIQG